MKAAVVFTAALVALAGAGSAQASAIIDRNAQHVRLAVDGNGQALISYEAHGQVMHVRAWGAINARQPTSAVAQVRFRKDYSGRSWTSFKNTCRAYDGPKLAFQVAACAASDGSYWALQSWRRTLPNFDGRAAFRSRQVGAASLALVGSDRDRSRRGRTGSTAAATTISSAG